MGVIVSHPTRVRGLKLSYWTVNTVLSGRTLHGCVDWNWFINTQIREYKVAPYTGAWIEIKQSKLLWEQRWCRTLHGCVDWNHSSKYLSTISSKSHPTRVRGLKLLSLAFRLETLSRTLHGCVDWNQNTLYLKMSTTSRTLHGCVDWNEVTKRHEYLSI